MSRERLWPLLQRGSLCASEDVQLIILLVSAMHKQGRLRPPYPITLLGTSCQSRTRYRALRVPVQPLPHHETAGKLPPPSRALPRMWVTTGGPGSSPLACPGDIPKPDRWNRTRLQEEQFTYKEKKIKVAPTWSEITL